MLEKEKIEQFHINLPYILHIETFSLKSLVYQIHSW